MLCVHGQQLIVHKVLYSGKLWLIQLFWLFGGEKCSEWPNNGKWDIKDSINFEGENSRIANNLPNSRFIMPMFTSVIRYAIQVIVILVWQFSKQNGHRQIKFIRVIHHICVYFCHLRCPVIIMLPTDMRMFAFPVW